MNSANSEPTTVRNTPSPIVAAGRDDAPVPGKSSSIAPTSSQGLAVNLCCDNHHATMAPITARNSNVMLTARVSLSGSWGCRLVLRHEILLSAWHAVIVGPAIDHW